MSASGDISLLFLSIIVWSVALYSLRVAFVGDPLFASVFRADDGLLKRVGRVVSEGVEPSAEDEILFLRHFTRLGMLGTAAAIAEIAALVYVASAEGMLPWLAVLAWGLLAKNAAMLLLNWFYVRSHHRPDVTIFDQLRTLPRWYVWIDRGSSLVSALGLLAVILALNGFVGGGRV